MVLEVYPVNKYYQYISLDLILRTLFLELKYAYLARGMHQKVCTKCLKEERGAAMKVCRLSVTQCDAVGEGWISVYVDLNSLKDRNGKILQARIAWEAVSYGL